MIQKKSWSVVLVALVCLGWSSVSAATQSLGPNTVLLGQQMQWHKLAFQFNGPQASESGTPNPFMNYRLNVTFTHVASNRHIVVPGFFAADGNAANTGATSGHVWEADFAPDATGSWTYTVSFRTGTDVAISLSSTAGTPTSIDGEHGSFTVDPSDKTGVDFRGKGRLQDVGQHYLQFLGSKEYFVKTGAGSPETFLAYADFDNTVAGASILHHYNAHVQDYRSGDPTWKGGLGKGIIGGINYLSSRGVNSLYFLSMNLAGQCKNVWPYANTSDLTRFDVSKLGQWEIVFQHMDKMGILLHMFTQERSNDQLLDNGSLGRTRKVYYRELIARFGHHLGLIWNLGEEITDTTSQQISYADYFNSLDPYLHHIDVHTYPSERDSVYTPLLGVPVIDGAALQVDPSIAHSETLKWISKSAAAGNLWVVNVDEEGSANVGAMPDANDYNHTSLARQVLWGNLFAGGGGVEWYFGYSYPNNDMNCEDWRSRDHLWTLSRNAANFVRTYMPLPLVNSCDKMLSCSTAYALGKAGVAYAIFLPGGATTTIALPAGESYTVDWFNPRTGGALVKGAVTTVGGGTVSIGRPPTEQSYDWVALLRRSGTSTSTTPSSTSSSGTTITGLTLIDAANQTSLGALTNGATISFSKDGTALNVQANVGSSTASVAFYLDGKLARTESTAPYALGGDSSGVYSTWTPTTGSHTLHVVPYPSSNAGGTPGTALDVSFTVTQ